MANGMMREAVRQLRRAALLQDNSKTDAQLLESFLTRREEASFEVLVRRHGPMVLGVCRRVLHDPHDAEDAFQATFLVLARRAASVVPREQVGSWLYGVAYRTALKARTARARRRKYERQALAAPRAPEDSSWPDLRPLLDRELQRLPDAYRASVVLCDLEGRTKREAARQLGVPEGTLSSRLARGRAMLRARLARRGVVLSLGALAASASGVSARLVASTVGAATRVAAGQALTATVSATVAALTEGMVKAMVIRKVMTALAVGLAVCLVGLGVGVGVCRTRAAETGGTEEQAEASRPAPGPKRGGDDTPKELLLPPASALTLALVRLDDEGRLLVVRVRFTRPDGSEVLTTSYYDGTRARVYEGGGKAVPPKALRRLLKQETLAFVAFGEQAVDPAYLRLLKEGTLVFLLPEPKPEASQPPPRLVSAVPLPALAPENRPAPPNKEQENEVEAVLLERLRRDGRLREPGLDYEIYVKRVEGRRLVNLVCKRQDKQGAYDLVAEAQEAELRVDLSRRKLLLVRMLWGTFGGQDGKAFFEERTFEIPLPEDFIRNAVKEGPRTKIEPASKDGGPPETDVFVIDQRSFEVPFQVDPGERRVEAVVLYVSTDQGRSWRKVAMSPPSEKSFRFQAPSDGVYWFSIGTVTRNELNELVASPPRVPGLKVKVDTSRREPPRESGSSSPEGIDSDVKKYFEMAEFYRRKGHAASAAFYYELVLEDYEEPERALAAKARERLRELPTIIRPPVGKDGKPPYRVGRIIIAGNRKTPDHVILEQLPLFPGQLLNDADLRVAEQNLKRLNLFRVLPRVVVIDREGPWEYRNILIQVEEK